MLKNIKTRIGVIYVVLVVLVLVDRINTLLRFSILYTDSDQTLLWQVSKDLMNGIFHAPCFYGQSYNPIFEPLFSLPFLFFGMEYSSALPLVTAILSVLPFLLLSLYLYKKIDPLSGLLPLIILLLMSTEYGMLTTIPRGFVTGIFFAVIGLILLLFHKSYWSRFMGGLFIGIGIYGNPNCILLIPILIPYLPKSWKEYLKLLKYTIPGFLLGISLIGINALYYSYNPDLIIHPSPKINFSIYSFFHVIGMLDNYFDFVTPVLWRAGWISLSFFAIVGIRLWKFNFKIESITLFTLLSVIIVSFSVSKVADATNSVFFSGSRMYLTYPYLIIFILFLFTKTLSWIKKKRLYAIIITLSVISFTIKMLAFNSFMEYALRGSAYTVVEVIPLQKLKNTCKEMVTFTESKVDLIVANSGSSSDQLITYGCPCLMDFPQTIQPFYERRTWLLPKSMNNIYNRILIYGKDTTLMNSMPLTKLDIIKTDTVKNWILFKNNTETQHLYHKLGLELTLKVNK